jgi:hypothetical protein
MELFEKLGLSVENEGDMPRIESLAEAYKLGLDTAVQNEMRLDDEQDRMFEVWRKEQDAKVAARQKNKEPYYGAIGGAYVWTRCGTTLGLVIKVRNDLTGDQLDLTDYHNW